MPVILNWYATKIGSIISKRIGAVTKILIKLGTFLWNFTERKQWKLLRDWMKGWELKSSAPLTIKSPQLKKHPEITLGPGGMGNLAISMIFNPLRPSIMASLVGGSLDEFIANSQSYQGTLIQYATECYRRLSLGSPVLSSSISLTHGHLSPGQSWELLENPQAGV